MPTVSMRRCSNYDQSAVDAAVSGALSDLGVLSSFVAPGEDVFLKINLIMPLPPERAATTHPSVVRALCRLIIQRGARVTIGDCPGYPLSRSFLAQTYRTTGMEQVALDTGANLMLDTESETIPVPGGKLIRSLPVASSMARADVIINMPKMKTHGLTLFTGAVKNMFGLVPGLKKAEYHAKMPGINEFSELLIDIALAKKPRLTVMDAVTCMEGAGPTQGTPVDVGAIIVSEDQLALDFAACRLGGIDPMAVSTLALARSRGLLPKADEDVSIIGDAVSPVNLKLPPASSRNTPLKKYLPDWASNALIRLVRPLPEFSRSTCTGCRTCERQCPPNAIKVINGLPVVDLNKCIRCFCCHELCPRGAVNVRRPLLGRLIMRERL